jgi:hypothetical protein
MSFHFGLTSTYRDLKWSLWVPVGWNVSRMKKTILLLMAITKQLLSLSRSYFISNSRYFRDLLQVPVGPCKLKCVPNGKTILLVMAITNRITKQLLSVVPSRRVHDVFATLYTDPFEPKVKEIITLRIVIIFFALIVFIYFYTSK